MQDRRQEKAPFADTPWGVRDVLWGSLVTLALTGGALVALVLALWLSARGQGSLRLPVLASAAIEALLIPPAWFWGPGRHGGGWASLGLRRTRLGKALLLGIVALGAILAVNALWEPLRERLNWPGQPAVLPLFGNGLAGLWWAWLTVGVVAPLAEELFFRGFMYAGLRKRWGVAWGLILSSVVFAAAHLIPGVLPPIFLMGLILALLYELTGSLWPNILLHSGINTLALLAAYIVEQFPST